MRPEHRRKNPPPTILEEQGEGVVLLAYGEPHDPCPVVCGLSLQPDARPDVPWGEDDAWWRHPDQRSPSTGAGGFLATRPTPPTRQRP